MSNSKKDLLLKKLRDHETLTGSDIIRLIILLSIPAILSNLSTIAMQYIDASMVGHLSSQAAAAIGLMATSTWLLSGLSMSATIGFSVQAAHAIGAKNNKLARQLVRVGLVAVLLVSLFHGGLGVAASPWLPAWLGGEDAILADASTYFLIFALSIPILQINSICGAMLQASGDMKTPSFLHILMCFLDVIFNAVLIFPKLDLPLFGLSITIPGADLGVLGAALGTMLAQLTVAIFMLFALLVRSDILHLQKDESLISQPDTIKILLKKAVKIVIPVYLEQFVMCSAQIMSTKIVASLGLAAIAANSFSITIEGLCYMPGFGVAAAATTLIGQSIGAKRPDITRRFAWSTLSIGVAIMTIMGILMYVFAPVLITSLSPDPVIQQLGTTILRIESLCEPFYGMAIVATGVFRGSGDTVIPSSLDFITMWFIRLPLAYIMAVTMGLNGVWIAMATELCCRGLLFLFCFVKKFQNKSQKIVSY